MPLSAEIPTPTKLGRDLDQTKVRTRSLLNKFIHRCNFKLAIFRLFDHNLPFSSLKGYGTHRLHLLWRNADNWLVLHYWFFATLVTVATLRINFIMHFRELVGYSLLFVPLAKKFRELEFTENTDTVKNFPLLASSARNPQHSRVFYDSFVMPFYEIWVTERHNGLHAVKGFSPLWIYLNISSHCRGWSTTGRKRLIANGQWIMRLPIGLCWARSWQTFVQNTPYTRSNSWTTPRLLLRFIQKVR